MLYTISGSTATAWQGEPLPAEVFIDGTPVTQLVTFPTNIAYLWTDEKLAEIGLFKVEQADTIPASKQAASMSVAAVNGRPKWVYVLEDIPPLNPSDFPLADWQLRKGLVLNGYSLDAIEATIKAIPDQAERELRWLAWDRPAVINWDSPTTQSFISWLGIPSAYAVDMWLTAKDYTLTL